MQPQANASARSGQGGSDRSESVTGEWFITPRAFAMLLAIDPEHPEPRKIRRAVEALGAGGVIAYPTDTVYGLGCDLMSKKAIDSLYAIKGMPRSQQLAFVCRDI